MSLMSHSLAGSPAEFHCLSTEMLQYHHFATASGPGLFIPWLLVSMPLEYHMIGDTPHRRRYSRIISSEVILLPRTWLPPAPSFRTLEEEQVMRRLLREIAQDIGLEITENGFQWQTG